MSRIGLVLVCLFALVVVGCAVLNADGITVVPAGKTVARAHPTPPIVIMEAIDRGGLLCATEPGNCVESWNGADIVIYTDTGSTQKFKVEGSVASANSATTNENVEISFTSPVDTTGTNTHNALTIDLAIGNATGGTNAVRALQIDGITGDAEVTETAINVGSGWDTVANTPLGGESIGSFPTIASAAITQTQSGAVFTVADGEIWIVHDVLVRVTTNFDCSGDDCTLTIGDGNDADGFIVLADAEMQAADTEFTGAAAGWQGMSAATRGVYLDEVTNNSAHRFVYAPSGAAETVDAVVGGTSPTAGAATIYIIYTRIQ